MDAKSALTVLTRLSNRKLDQVDKLQCAVSRRFRETLSTAVTVASETGEPMGLVLAEEIAKRRLGMDSFEIWEITPRNSITLLEFSRELTDQCIRNFSFESASPEEHHRLSLIWLDRAQVHLSKGFPAGCLAATEVALTQLKLVTHFEAFDVRSEVISALILRSKAFRLLDQSQEALNAASMAHSLAHEATTVGYQPASDLIPSATVEFARCQAALGDREDAVQMLDFAIKLLLALDQERPGVFDHDIADARTAFGTTLERMDHFDWAHSASSTALALWRELDDRAPDTHRRELFACCTLVARIRCALGRHEDAIALAEEAVHELRFMNAARPIGLAADLAEALRVLSMIYVSIDHKNADLIASECEFLQVIAEKAHQVRLKEFADISANDISNGATTLSPAND